MLFVVMKALNKKIKIVKKKPLLQLSGCKKWIRFMRPKNGVSPCEKATTFCNMFILTEVEDTVKIEPKNFSKADNEAIQDVLNYKFANKVEYSLQRECVLPRKLTIRLKVIPDVGLCVCVHDILEATPGTILHLDGCSYVKSKDIAKRVSFCPRFINFFYF